MGKILLSIILSALIVSVGYCQEAEQPLQLTIKSDKEAYKVGESIVVDVVIKNNSDKTLWIVKPQHGSETKRRYPKYYFEIRDSKGKILDNFISYYKAFSPLTREGFFQIEPNQSVGIKELRDEHYAFKRAHKPIERLSGKAGKYSITFHYSTDAQDDWQWHGYWDERYKLWIKDEKELEEAKIIFKELSRMSLASNTITIEVVERNVNEGDKCSSDVDCIGIDCSKYDTSDPREESLVPRCTTLNKCECLSRPYI